MLRRLANVGLNYLTRPMVWVVGGIYVVILGASLFSARREATSHRTIPQQAAFPQMAPWGSLTDLNSAQPQSIVDIQRVRDAAAVLHQPTAFPLQIAEAPIGRSEQATTMFSAAHLRRLHGAPHLGSLALRSPIMLSPEEAQALGDLRQIESLSLSGCGIGPELWRQLSKLPKLRYLDIGGCRLSGDYPSLESMAHLETLVLGTPATGGIIETDAPLFPELHRLPRLTTLVVSDYIIASTPPRSNNEVAKHRQPPATPPVNPLRENIGDLRKISTLQQVFAYEQSVNFPGLDKPQQELPNVKIRPAFVDAERQQSILMLVFLNSILLLLLALQIHSQFSHSGAQLIPNYTLPHVLPIVGIWLIGIVAQSLLLVARDVPFLPAIGANLISWIILCTVGMLGSLVNIAPQGRRWVMLPVTVIAASWFPLSVILLQFNRSSIDWYLRGREPLWTAFFIVSGVTIAVTALWRSLRLHTCYLERGISSPPLSLDPMAMADWQQQVYWRNAGSSGQVRDRRLARVISLADHRGWRRRSDLWIAGNSNSKALLFLIMFAVFLMGPIGWRAATPWQYDFPSLRSPQLLAMSVLFPDLPVIVIASLWRQRRRMFAIESLRPVSRAEFSREMATAIAWDLSPLAVVYLAVLGWYVAVADPLRWSWGWVAAMLLVFVARWIAAYGLILWSIVIHRDWLLVLISAISGYLLLFVNLGITFLQGPILGITSLPQDLPRIGIVGLTMIAAVFVLVASSVAAMAYRRWQRIEFL